jgi:hypothetical protein
MINILKRVRIEITPATNPITYKWSEWSITTDAPPYNNTLTVEYKTSNEYISQTCSIFKALMSASISENTPYKETLKFIQTEFDESSLTPKDAAMLKAQVMATITSSTTNTAMQLAPSIANKELRVDTELGILENQKDISSATKQFKIDQSKFQSKNTEQSYLFTKEKIQSLIKAAKDNNKIKAMEILQQLFGQHKIGGGTITTDMFALLFSGSGALYNNDEDATIITAGVSTT